MWLYLANHEATPILATIYGVNHAFLPFGDQDSDYRQQNGNRRDITLTLPARLRRRK
jgi:hypothetical protein